jgi:hypothetical protein
MRPFLRQALRYAAPAFLAAAVTLPEPSMLLSGLLYPAIGLVAWPLSFVLGPERAWMVSRYGCVFAVTFAWLYAGVRMFDPRAESPERPPSA